MRNGKKKIVNISTELKAATRKNFDIRIVIYLIVGFILIAAAFYADVRRGGEGGDAVRKLCETKAGILADLFDIIMTLHTILVAVVVFFYSIQDNRSGGIPYRTIMAYAVGSLSIPVLFIWTILLLPANFFAVSSGYHCAALIGLVYTYLTQMLIMILILLSTSFQYSVHTIGNAEIRQFRKLNDLEEKRCRSDCTQGEASGKETEQNPRFVWTYLLHHLEQVLLSDEVVADKQQLIRRLIRAPYYQKAVSFRGKVCQSAEKGGWKGKSKPRISERRLSSNQLKSVYEFYYLNFLEVFRRINEPKDLEERNKIYLILYEFLEELTELYEGVNRNRFSEESIRNCRENYLMTISGILNAMMDSAVENGESACNYVLNIIVSQEVRGLQMGLFFLFQEFLFHTNITVINLNELDKIDELDGWECREKERDFYSRFWQIWMEFSTLSRKAGCEYFDRAFRALRGEDYNEGPASYISLTIQRIKGGRAYAGKNYHTGE